MLQLPLPLTIFDLENLLFVDSFREIIFPQKSALLANGLRNLLGFRAGAQEVLQISLFLSATELLRFYLHSDTFWKFHKLESYSAID